MASGPLFCVTYSWPLDMLRLSPGHHFALVMNAVYDMVGLTAPSTPFIIGISDHISVDNPLSNSRCPTAQGGLLPQMVSFFQSQRCPHKDSLTRACQRQCLYLPNASLVPWDLLVAWSQKQSPGPPAWAAARSSLALEPTQDRQLDGSAPICRSWWAQRT